MKHFLSVTGRITVLLFFSLFALTSSLFAQDSKGRDFWLMFPANYDISASEVKLFISGDASTSGVVSIPGIGFSTPFTVTPGSVTTVDLPSDVQCDFSSTILSNGIHVTADAEITVYGLNRELASTDAFLGLPTDILGTEYINLGYYNSNIVNGTQFGIVATQNNTTVSITPSVATDGHDAGVAYNIILDQGQTYLLRNTGSAPNDLSGSIVTSDKPVAMFGGHRCANIPGGYSYCDYIVEELPPTSAWGKNFVTLPLKTRTAGDTFRMLASTDNTTVNINGAFAVTLNRGQYYETILTAASQITSSKPILVAQYSNSTSFDGITSDPFEMLIPPYEQFLGDYTITTPASGFNGNYVNVVAPTTAVGSIKLDGTAIPAGSFSPIGSSGFSGAQVDISLGVHTFNGSNLPFGVFVYGFDVADSYGYPGGESLAPVAEVTTVSLSPETGSGAVGTNQCFTASVRDQFSAPLVGVRVDYTVMGANAGTSGFDNTGSGGNAQFCYTGTNAGIDTIIASVGTLSDTSYFTWTKQANNAPQFAYPPTPVDGTTYDVMAGQNVNFNIQATDADAGDNIGLTATGVPSGAASSLLNGNPATGNFNWTPGAGDVGTYTIRYKADDGNGGIATTNVVISVSSTCDCDPNFATHIGVIPKYTVKGQDYHTIYKGYGPQRVALLAAHHGGTPPYKYEWNDGATAHIRVVSPDMTTTYSVTITDAHGCKTSCSVTVYVVDVRCTTTPGNIFICNDGQTMSIPKADVQQWLDRGAKLGQCNRPVPVQQLMLTARTTTSLPAVSTGIPAFTVYPNPAKTDISFAWSAPAGSNAKVIITDLQGRILMTQSLTNSPQHIGISQLANGVYMAKLVTANGTLTTSRFMVNK